MQNRVPASRLVGTPPKEVLVTGDPWSGTCDHALTSGGGHSVAHRDVAQYEGAKSAIRNYLRDGDWHASKDIHERLADEVPKDWIFGAVKKDSGSRTAT